MYVIIWKYQVKPERLTEFEKVYSADGAWAELFREAAGYLKTELLHDSKDVHSYMTIDRWKSSTAYETFLEIWGQTYETLDAQCEGLTESEVLLGRWETLHPETN